MILTAAIPAANASRLPAASPVESELVKQLSALTGPRDAVLVAAPDGRPLAAIHADRPLIPASILKLLTNLAALEQFGPDYRFITDFYLDPGDNLKIKGYGDPLLISETLKTIAAHLAPRVPVVHGLVMDDAFFSQPVRISGRANSMQPYEAPNGALCANGRQGAASVERLLPRWSVSLCGHVRYAGQKHGRDNACHRKTDRLSNPTGLRPYVRASLPPKGLSSYLKARLYGHFLSWVTSQDSSLLYQ